MASQRIHGITVDLDVNTSGVSEAFSDINKSLRGTQQELKSVDRLLKEDANNVTLLSQKQYLLTDAIDKTQDKLVQLAKAKRIADSDDSVDKSSKQYRELERDIARTKQSLDDLTEKQKQNNAQLQNAKNNAEGIARAFDDASEGGLKFGDIVKANVVSDAIISGIKALASAIKDVALELNNWANDYRELEVYEKQFESNIRNTANASDEEIKKLKQLASAKERQGVISKRSITSAYQELATYVESTDAIEGLTDALLDMSAQQYGVDATEESVRNIATTLGKALANGDYSGLTRLGYGFNDAQKYIMEYGNEMERVAVLNEVIGSSIGGINEALANTDEGKLFQFANVFDDAKESVGQLVSELELNFLEGVMPSIEEAIGGFMAWLDENREPMLEMVQNIVEWLTSDETKQFFADMVQLVQDIGQILVDVVQLTDDLGLLKGALELIKIVVQGIRDIVHAIKEDFRYIKENGFGSWAMGNYNSTDWNAGGNSWDAGWSGGFGALNSGGFRSGGITINAQFTINESTMNRNTIKGWGYELANAINEALGEQI